MTTLIVSKADMNCIQDWLIPTQYFEKTREEFFAANKRKLDIKYKHQNVHICQNNYCFKTQFMLIRNMTEPLILGTPFITLLYPFQVIDEGIKTTILENTIFFPFIYPLTKKEIYHVTLQNLLQGHNNHFTPQTRRFKVETT